VDALDEIPDSGEREKACTALKRLCRNPRSHILTTSRREHYIIEVMSEIERVQEISIQNPEADRDIGLYIRERLKGDEKLKKWSAMHSEIEAALIAKADGM
jgi:hypothetical protein